MLRYWLTLKEIWDWFWLYRHGKIKYTVYLEDDTYHAVATNGGITVFRCYGSTPQKAMEIANFKLKQAIEKYGNEKDIEYIGDGIVVCIHKNKL